MNDRGKLHTRTDGVADMIEAAEAAVAKLEDQYGDWLRQDITKMQVALDAALADSAGRAKHLESLFAVAHDIKGQGGSFGYDLITTIGGSLCDFIKSGHGETERGLAAIAAHITALDMIAEAGLKGDGGEGGRDILADLSRIVSEASA